MKAICKTCRGVGNLCVTCNSTGSQVRCRCNARECDVCDGEGVRECDLGCEHECGECHGTGTLGECPQCHRGWLPGKSATVDPERECRACPVCNGKCNDCDGKGVVEA